MGCSGSARARGSQKLVLLSLAKSLQPRETGVLAVALDDCFRLGIHPVNRKAFCLDDLVNLGEFLSREPRESGPHESNFYRLPAVEKWLSRGAHSTLRGARSAPPMGAQNSKRGVLTAPRTCNRTVKNEEPTDADASSSTASCGNLGARPTRLAAASLWADPSARRAATEMLQKSSLFTRGPHRVAQAMGKRTNGCRISMAGLAQLLPSSRPITIANERTRPSMISN